MFGFGIASAEFLLSQLKSGSFTFIDGKGDSATTSKLASVLGARGKGTLTTGGEGSAEPTTTHTVQLTVTSKHDNLEDLALWPIDEADDWKGFFDTHLSTLGIQFHSLTDLEQSSAGFSLTLDVASSFANDELAEQLAQAFPQVVVIVESIKEKKLLNSFNPFALSSSADMSKHLAELL